MSIRIFLADDHAIVRDGLVMLLQAQPDLEVIGTAENGRQAVRQIKQLRPQVAILDITMPGLNGLEAARLPGFEARPLRHKTSAELQAFFNMA